MSDEKSRGKNRAPNEQTKPESGDATAPSLASRIGNSASALAQDLLNGASSSTSTLGTSLSATEKAQLPPTTFPQSADGSASAQLGRRLKDSTYKPDHQAQHGQFRNNYARDSSTVDSELEQHGFRDTLPLLHSITPNAEPQVSSWVSQYNKNGEKTQNSQGLRNKSAAYGGDIVSAEAADGLAVVDLLNDGKKLTDISVLEDEIYDSVEDCADDLFGQPLTEGEQEVKGKMLATLPSYPAYTPSDPASQLNFKPNVEMLHMPISVASGGLALSADSSVSYYSSHEERTQWMRQWLDEWDDILRNYTREVWGFAEPDGIEEARKELEQMRNDEDKWHDQQALRRLQMILRHVKVPEGARKPIPAI